MSTTGTSTLPNPASTTRGRRWDDQLRPGDGTAVLPRQPRAAQTRQWRAEVRRELAGMRLR